MEFQKCWCFRKDVKHLQKKCKGRELEKEIEQYLEWLISRVPDFDIHHTILYSSSKFTLFKTRIRGCGGRGKRGGLRLVWAVNKRKTKVFLVRLYSKSELENIPTFELVEQLLKCVSDQ